MEDKNNKERILNSARELFQKFGIRSITMDDIAHHLGISKKTIYQHFSDKDDIVTLAMRHHISGKKNILLRLRDAARDSIDLMITVNHYMQQDFSHNTSALLYDLQKYHPVAWKIISEFRNGFMRDFIRENLKAGIDQGHFRPDLDVEIITRVRIEETTMAHSDDMFPNDQFNHKGVSSSLLDHFIHAVSTERGKKLYRKYKNQITNKGLYQSYEV